MRRFVMWAVVCLVVAGGCRSGASNKPASEGDNEQALKELGEVYQYLAYEKRNPPVRATDLEEHEGSLQVALPKVRSGELVVAWGAGYTPGSGGVLAYEKDAPTSGGKVLLRNGTVKQVSAAEFATALRTQ